MRLHRPATLLLLIAAPAAAQEAAPATTVQLSYDLSLAGLPAGDIVVEAQFTPSGYRLRSSTRSVGVVDWIIGFRSQVESDGALGPAGPVPASHRADNAWRGETRTVRLVYLGRRVVRDEVVPSREAEEREPIPQTVIDRSLDPLAAGLELALAATRAAPSCTGAVAIFDGRRTYDLVLAGGSDDAVETDGFTGAALRCALSYERTGGRSSEPWIAGAHAPQSGALWLARLAPEAPLAPVRIEADAGIGEMVLSLRAWRDCGRGACPQPAAGD